MKTGILAGIIISGILATSVAQAATSPSVEETYSGMSAAAIQKDQQANPRQHALGMKECMKSIRCTPLTPGMNMRRKRTSLRPTKVLCANKFYADIFCNLQIAQALIHFSKS